MATTKKDAGKEPELLRKITVKAVTGGVDATLLEKMLKDAKRVFWLMEIIGIAKAGRVKATDYGESIGFIGSFEAKNLATGDLYRAPKLYLPKFLEEELYGALGDDAGSKASFAVRIGVKADMSAATKYVYHAEHLLKPVESDEMALLKASIAGALPAPAKAA